MEIIAAFRGFNIAYIYYLHYFCIAIIQITIMEKVIHVHLIFEKKDYYFGSFAAIYTVLTADQVGVTYNTLRNAKWKDISVYLTSHAVIKQGSLIRSGRK